MIALSEENFMPIGIVALSFAKRAHEPNPVNVKLAEITEDLNDRIQQMGESTVVVSQWEVALALPTEPSLIVTQGDATNLARNGESYLDSQDVLNKAFELFDKLGITEVAVVANRFIHLQAAESLVKQSGFTVFKYGAPAVGFDDSPLNLQWWCKGPTRFVVYLGLQAIGKATSQNLHGIGEKPRQY